MAPEYFNNSIAVEGEIIVKTMGSNAGSVVVWDAVSKKLSKRTPAQLVSDLGNIVPYTGATQALNMGLFSGTFNGVKVGHEVTGYVGFSSPKPFAFTNNNSAQTIYTGGILVSDSYQNSTKVPTLGIYSQGIIHTDGGIKYVKGINISSTDLDTLTDAGFYIGGSLLNAPNTGWFYVTVERYHVDNQWVHQTITSFGSGNTANITYSRVKVAGVWTPWSTAWTSDNLSINLSNYYTKTESLNLFVGLNGVQTIYDTKTFNNSPVVPNGTLNSHAVNLWQLQNHSHSWSTISDKPTAFPPTVHGHDWVDIAGKPSVFPPSAHAHAWADISGKPTAFPPSAHGHDWADIAGKPTAFPPSAHGHSWSEISGIPSAFPATAHSHAIGDVTGLQGVLSELSGLAHAHANKTVLDGITSSQVSDWNAIAADGIRNNGQAFDYNTGNGLGIGDGAYGSESGLFDYSTDYLVVGVLGDYYHYGSADGGYSANGITVGKYTGNVGIGGYNTSIYKALVHGAIAATQGFVHTAHNSRDKVLLSNGNIASATVDVVNDGGTLRMQDFFADISGGSFFGSDTPHKLVHLMISSGHFDLYSLQDGQRIVLINDTGGQCLVKIEDLDAYVIEPKEKVTLYVVNAGNYYFYDASMHTKFTF